MFMRMGLPQIITSDQGGEFVNNLNKKLMSKLGIKHHLTTAYHPQVCMYTVTATVSFNIMLSIQANGLVERYNQTLQNMLIKYVNEKQDLWDEFLDTSVSIQNLCSEWFHLDLCVKAQDGSIKKWYCKKCSSAE